MKIERDDDFGGAVLNCAVRYALGRMSYMPNLVMDEIILPYTLTERRGRRSGKNTLDILSVANANTGMNRKKMKTKETDLHFALVVVGP